MCVKVPNAFSILRRSLDSLKLKMFFSTAIMRWENMVSFRCGGRKRNTQRGTTAYHCPREAGVQGLGRRYHNYIGLLLEAKRWSHHLMMTHWCQRLPRDTCSSIGASRMMEQTPLKLYNSVPEYLVLGGIAIQRSTDMVEVPLWPVSLCHLQHNIITYIC